MRTVKLEMKSSPTIVVVIENIATSYNNLKIDYGEWFRSY